MKKKKALRFPPLHLKGTLEETNEAYIKALRKSSRKNLLALPYANKLMDARSMLAPTNFKKFYDENEPQDTFINKLTAFLTNWAKEENTPLKLSWRVKEYISFNKKIRQSLIRDEPLSKILDLIGLRIIVGDSQIDNSLSVSLCYKLASDIQRWLILEMKSTLMDSEPRKSPDITVLDDNVDESSIWIPERSMIPRSFQNNWKDYVAFPKSNGYQGLHLVFRLSYPVFLEMELQIRSFAMDQRDEYGPCAHILHKENTYPTVFKDLKGLSTVGIPQSIPIKGEENFHP